MRTMGRMGWRLALAAGSLVAVGVVSSAALLAQASAGPEIRVVLLGTGSPRPRMDRFGPSILVAAGPERLVFDVGRGAAQRLHQLEVPFAAVSGVFLTHLHSDHVVGLPDLWLTGWLLGNRAAPLEVWGPAGTAAMAAHLEAAFAFDTDIRVRDDRLPAAGGHLRAHDVGEGVVLVRNGVTVTAFAVDHGPVRPALGYRIDYAGRSVVLSGDTRASPNLVRHAAGADLLIHEVAAATAEDLRTVAHTRTVVGHHTTPEQAGEVFRAVAPKLAVYSHLVLFSGLTPADLIPLTRARYAGPLVVGADLMAFRIGDSVTVEPPAAP
jgi:ribonuclease Z